MEFIKRNMRTKTFWAGLGMLAAAGGMYAQGDAVQAVQTALMGLATIAGRNAIGKLKSQ